MTSTESERLRELVAKWRNKARHRLNDSEALANMSEELRSQLQLARGRVQQECADDLEAALSDVPAPGPRVTPEMMSTVFAKSVRSMDPEHQHIYDHRIAAELLNEMLAAAPDAGVREAALRDVATYLETATPEHSPDCSYGATNGPHGDFCDCGLTARRIRRTDLYATVRAALAGVAQPAPPPAQQALNATFDPVKSQLRSRQTVEDGFGSVWLKACPEPGCTGEMHVMRPGDVTCDREHTHKALRAAAQSAPPKDTK